jgi:hypothetical protein
MFEVDLGKFRTGDSRMAWLGYTLETNQTLDRWYLSKIRLVWEYYFGTYNQLIN